MTRAQHDRIRAAIVTLSILVAWSGPALAAPAAEPAAETSAEPPVGTGAAAFETLKQLTGRWEGTFGYDGQEETYPVTHEFRAFGHGTAVMESMFSGTDDEMISMYHLDGDDLVMTHYCAIGNQPRMKLDTEHSSETLLPFVFAGGSNLDPAKDTHLHSGTLTLQGDGTIESAWTRWVAGEQVGVVRLKLSRQPAAAED